jgi:hypothetical protein
MTVDVSPDAAAPPTPTERQRIRALATRWQELASEPVVAERKRAWRALHDLRPERPMVLVETGTIDGFVRDGELECRHPILRSVEHAMLETVRHAEELGDDIVLEPYYRIGWSISDSGWGVEVVQEDAAAPEGELSIGYTFNFPIKTPDDVALLRPRSFRVDHAWTRHRQRLIEDVVGDILPIRLGNYDHFGSLHGEETFLGNFFLGLTWQIYRFTGNDGLLTWLIESPETIHRLMEYMTADREQLFGFLEREGLLVPNTDTQMAGPRAYGYVSDLPSPDASGPATLLDAWCWAESQETTVVSPAMYREFFLPYLARLAQRFGLVYYGCCEPVHDRLDAIIEAMPNLRSVSVSPWSDQSAVAEMLGRRYVYSRKPDPVPISGPNPHWENVEADLRATREATRAHDCNVELLFRDVYTIEGDPSRMVRWVELAKSIFGI